MQKIQFHPQPVNNDRLGNDDSVAKLVIDFSHPWLKSTRKRDKYASGGPGRPVSACFFTPFGVQKQRYPND
ncbi:hypothetical protein TUM19329_06930 [Legionella antarctica]|uniref:Uncharacterized protein n=1 Tax=Legionella antarctica TaxID=2708020 RepID=A0A6F8T2T6_9GAMM|nr:hypothetical protein [Legionella antarctica]BCA94332.1 hypothetical protein TUM19329_06930 [Legionella antarctica]